MRQEEKTSDRGSALESCDEMGLSPLLRTIVDIVDVHLIT
jgi:hypothetical protein